MYVCACVCMSECFCFFVFVWVHGACCALVQDGWACMWFMFLCARTHTYTHTHTLTHIRTHTLTHIHTHKITITHSLTHSPIHIQTRLRRDQIASRSSDFSRVCSLYLHIYVHTHTYTHPQLQWAGAHAVRSNLHLQQASPQGACPSSWLDTLHLHIHAYISL